MVYFAHAVWRSAGTIGDPSLFLSENDTGPDDAVHSFDGIYSVSDPRSGAGAHGPTERGIDLGPTVLALLGVLVPESLRSRLIERSF